MRNTAAVFVACGVVASIVAVSVSVRIWCVGLGVWAGYPFFDFGPEVGVFSAAFFGGDVAVCAVCPESEEVWRDGHLVVGVESLADGGGGLAGFWLWWVFGVSDGAVGAVDVAGEGFDEVVGPVDGGGDGVGVVGDPGGEGWAVGGEWLAWGDGVAEVGGDFVEEAVEFDGEEDGGVIAGELWAWCCFHDAGCAGFAACGFGGVEEDEGVGEVGGGLVEVVGVLCGGHLVGGPCGAGAMVILACGCSRRLARRLRMSWWTIWLSSA